MNRQRRSDPFDKRRSPIKRLLMLCHNAKRERITMTDKEKTEVKTVNS